MKHFLWIAFFLLVILLVGSSYGVEYVDYKDASCMTECMDRYHDLGFCLRVCR